MLGEKIRAARLEQKLTQEQLAGRDFAKSYISELERGVRTPRLTTLKILARRLNRPISYFLDGVPEDGEPEAFLTIGLAHLHADSVHEAKSALERGLDLSTQHGDEALQARFELALAMVDRELGHLAQAGRRVERSIRALSRMEDWPFLARAHACLGRIRLDAGDATAARWAFEVALRIAHDHAHDPALVADLNLSLGEAHRRLGQSEESHQALRQALEVAEPFRDQYRVGARYLELASDAAEHGRFDAATEQAGRALAVYDSIAHKRRLAEIHHRLGEADIVEGRWEEAQDHYRWSIALHGAVANCRGVAQTMGCLVEAMLERVPPEAARAVGETALALLTDDDDLSERPYMLRLRGTICRLLGRAAESRAALEESLRLFGEMQRPQEVRLVRQELALLAIEAEDHAEARRHLKLLRDQA